MLELIGYFSAFFVGLVLGALGGGGSILAFPIMVTLFHIPAERATIYSLFIIGITSLFGTFQHLKTKMVQPKNAILFAIPAVISITLTRLFVMPIIPKMVHIGKTLVFNKDTFISILFGLLMIIASIPMLRGQKERPASKRPRPVILIVFGAVVGFLSGLVGAGGGFLIIPALSIFMRLPIKNAIATSVMIIAINSISGFIADISRNAFEIDWKFLLIFTSIALTGLATGLLIVRTIKPEPLKKGFGYFVLAIGIYLLVAELI